jgi:hypothetical protein
LARTGVAHTLGHVPHTSAWTNVGTHSLTHTHALSHTLFLSSALSLSRRVCGWVGLGVCWENAVGQEFYALLITSGIRTCRVTVWCGRVPRCPLACALLCLVPLCASRIHVRPTSEPQPLRLTPRCVHVCVCVCVCARQCTFFRRPARRLGPSSFIICARARAKTTTSTLATTSCSSSICRRSSGKAVPPLPPLPSPSVQCVCMYVCVRACVCVCVCVCLCRCGKAPD